MTASIQPGAMDAHCAFRDPARAQSLPGAAPEPDAAFLPGHLAPLLEASGVERAIVVQTHPPDEGGDWLLDAAGAAPFVAGVVAWLDLASPDALARLESLARHPKLKGVRCDAEREVANDWLLRDDLQPALRALAERELTLDLAVSTRHLRRLPELAARYPRLRFVIEHMARPRVDLGQTEPWGTMMRAVAACPNVWCKVSGLLTPGVSVRAQTARLRPFAAPLVRTFGFERLMFGSDWPASAQAAPYDQTLAAAIEAVGPASDAQLRRFLGAAAAECYRLD